MESLSQLSTNTFIFFRFLIFTTPLGCLLGEGFVWVLLLWEVLEGGTLPGNQESTQGTV